MVRPIAGFLVAEDQLVWRTKVSGERKEGSNDVSRGGIQCMEESADNSLLTRNRVSHFEFERAKTKLMENGCGSWFVVQVGGLYHLFMLGDRQPHV